MRAWTIFSLAVGVSLWLLAPAASEGRGFQGVPQLGYAAILHHKGAPAGRKFSVQLFTKYAHEKEGDAVYARARRPHADVYAHQKGKNNGWDVWHITRRKRDGRRLIRELRREMSHKGRAKLSGTLLRNNAISGCPVRFKLPKYNKAYPGKQLICPQ
jgi:hypothetical protein